MTTGEAAVATLLAHGLDTVYALPGVHNDHLFDAFQRAGDNLRVVHARHEQGAAYMALGAALATAKPQAYAVVPGPGLLNSGAALLTAYGMNAPVLAIIGQIPAAAIGKSHGHLHEIRDQGGIIARLVDHYSHYQGEWRRRRRRSPTQFNLCIRTVVGRLQLNVQSMCGAKVVRSKQSYRPRRHGPPKSTGTKCALLQRFLGKAKRVMIVTGGGAQDASLEVTLLSSMLQAPVLGYRRGRGVLDLRDPLSVTLPLGRDLWAEADAVLAVGTRLLTPLTAWGVDKNLQIVRVDADPEQPARLHKPNVALVGDTAPIPAIAHR